MANQSHEMKLIEKFLERQVRIISGTDINRITVSEIARFFFMPHWLARFLLNMGVLEGKFKKNEDGTYKFLNTL